MSATVSCPHCNGKIVAEARIAGREVGCPHCNGRVIMPKLATAPRPSPALPAIVEVEPPPLPTAAQQTTTSVPRLWNPNTAGLLSVILWVGLGPFLVARNWKALGNEMSAKRSMIWFYAFVAYLAVATLIGFVMPVPLFSDRWFLIFGGSFAAVLIWYFLEQKSQMQCVNERFGDKYPRKSLVRPILCGLGIWVVAGGLGALAAVARFTSNADDIATVKAGHLTAHPNVSVGVAASNFMENPQWTSGVSDSGIRFVNLRSRIMRSDGPVDALIQFDIHGTIFNVRAIEFNGVPQNNAVANRLLTAMFGGQ
jgi:DNA-directed RNA polymerase subunit RPC12/RpoP